MRRKFGADMTQAKNKTHIKRKKGMAITMTDMVNTAYVNYEMFGAKGDGVTDDIEAIKAAHDYANLHKIDVKTNPKATYYIGPRPITVTVATNVDFNSSKFIIDDSKVKVEERGASLFRIVSEKEPIKLDIPYVKKNQMRLDVQLPCNCYVKIDNSEKKQFIRFGLNQNNGSAQTDCFVVDGTGYILNKVIWDFEKVTNAVAYPIDETILTVKGGIFNIIANQAESKYTYFGRNISVTRSNTVIDGLTHIVTGELDHGAPYSGFITVDRCAYVTVKNCHLSPRKIYETIGSAGKPVSMGSYALTGGSAVNLKLINIKQNNIMDRTHWGLMATNHCKDLYVEDCVMSRFDAHENVANLTIRNTVLGHQCFNAIGHGIMLVENVTAYGNSFLNLRGDYGSTWDGDIIFRNNTWYPNAAAKAPSFIGGSNAGDHDFGFPCYIPHKITIDGLLICDGCANEGYVGASLFNCSPSVMNGSGAPDYNDKSIAYPYFFAEEVTLRNIRTESGKGFAVFSADTKNCYCTQKHKKDKYSFVPNFRCKIEDTEMPEKSLVPETSLSLEDFGENYHLLPSFELKNCRKVTVNTNAPAIIKFTDCTLSGEMTGDNLKIVSLQ